MNISVPRTFNDLMRYLSSIKNIDSGGCGIAAYIMYHWLLSFNQSCNIFIVALYRSQENFDHNYNKINSDYLCVPSHIAIEVDGELYDRTGKIDNLYDKYHYLSISQLESMIISPVKNAWNHSFNRATSIKKLNKLLNVNLDHLL